MLQLVRILFVYSYSLVCFLSFYFKVFFEESKYTKFSLIIFGKIIRI